MAEIKRLDLCNLKPIYERELNKLDVHQVKGKRNVSRDGEGGKGCRHKYPERGEILCGGADEFWDRGCRMPDENTNATCATCPAGLSGSNPADRGAMQGSLNEGLDECVCRPGVEYHADPYVWPRTIDFNENLA